ncbi:uncharacterized protein LOC144887151 [Branchiostoma floridae x Branchiostoma japonicum]
MGDPGPVAGDADSDDAGFAEGDIEEVIELEGPEADDALADEIDEIDLGNYGDGYQGDEGAEGDMEMMTDDADVVFSKHIGSVFCIGLDRTTQSLAVTGGEDDKAYVWRLGDGEVLMECGAMGSSSAEQSQGLGDVCVLQPQLCAGCHGRHGRAGEGLGREQPGAGLGVRGVRLGAGDICGGNMCWKLLLVICAVAAFNIGSNADPTSVLSDEPRHRQKRNLWQFGKMIKKVTGRNALDYNNYGCYCGWGGAGVPVDNIDTCCRDHDLCYGGVKSPKLFTVYSYVAAPGVVTCNDAPGTNDRAVCECDRTAVLCFNANVYPPAKPPCPKPPADDEGPLIDLCPRDLMLLIDETHRIGRKAVRRVRRFFSDVIGCIRNGTDINVGVIRYECLPNVEIPLGSYTDTAGLQNAILSDVDFSGGLARTGAAINYMTCVTQFREQARKVAIVATDGSKRAKEIAYDTEESVKYAKKARDAGFELWTIATGRDLFINETALAIISGHPSRVLNLDLDNPCDVAAMIELCEP